ncbi:CopG family transcriptional regulator [Methanocorpusculum sp.]|nr:CopG family transcriptional regulator [Methanocorpusculum sp.]
MAKQKYDEKDLMVRVQVRMDRETLQLLDELAAAAGCNRSSMLRQLVNAQRMGRGLRPAP